MDVGAGRDVLKFEFPFVQIQFVFHLIARKVDVGQAVAVEVADADAAAVVDKFRIENIERVSFRNSVVEINTCLLAVEQNKKFLFVFATDERREKDNDEGCLFHKLDW